MLLSYAAGASNQPPLSLTGVRTLLTIILSAMHMLRYVMLSRLPSTVT